MRKNKILIVDDDQAILSMLETRLKHAGFEVLAVSGGEEALVAALKKPHLILLDIMMPGMDGYEVLERLLASKKTRTIPVVMLTSKTDTRSVARAINSGATDYLVKPFIPGVLVAKIKKILSKKKFLRRT